MKKIKVLFLFCCLFMFSPASSNAALVGYLNYDVDVTDPVYQISSGSFNYDGDPTLYSWYHKSTSYYNEYLSTGKFISSYWEITDSGGAAIYQGTINKITLNGNGYALDLSRFDNNGNFIEYLIQTGEWYLGTGLVHCSGRLDDYGIYNEAVEALSSEVSVQMDVLDTINQDQSSAYSMQVIAETAKLEIVANWGGSEMLLQVFDPLGNLYASKQATDPPIKIEVLNPIAGQWSFDITAIEVPYEHYPIAVMAGTSAVPIPGAVWLLGSGLIGILGFKRKVMNT